MQLSHGSLFSGIGGFELGAKMAGIKTDWNCEILEYNRKILLKNFPESKQYENIIGLEPDYVDIISGGFPCQDISIANVKGKGINGSRSGLWSEYSRIIRHIRPKYVVIENSSALLIRGFERVLCDLSQIGYDAEWQCLQASHFGYPHKRERIYVVAYPKRNRRTLRLFNINQKKFREVYERTSAQVSLLASLKEYERQGNSQDIRVNNELPFRVDRVKGCGNAVMPVIAHYLFECIKEHFNQVKAI